MIYKTNRLQHKQFTIKMHLFTDCTYTHKDIYTYTYKEKDLQREELKKFIDSMKYLKAMKYLKVFFKDFFEQ